MSRILRVLELEKKFVKNLNMTSYVKTFYKKKYNVITLYLFLGSFSASFMFQSTFLLHYSFTLFLKIVRSLPSCNNVKIELINRLILRRKEIHAGQNNLCRWIRLRFCESRAALSQDDLYFCSAHIWTLNAF